MTVRFKLSDEGHLVWDVERDEEITIQEAAVIATASIGNMLYGVSHALYDFIEEFRSKEFYDPEGTNPGLTKAVPKRRPRKAKRRAR